MAVVTPTDPSVRNHCVIEILVAVLCCQFDLFDISVGKGDFVIVPCHISSYFS